MASRRVRRDVAVAGVILACCVVYYVVYLAVLVPWASRRFIVWPVAVAQLVAVPIGLCALGYLLGALAGRWVRARTERARTGFRAFGAVVVIAYFLCWATLTVFADALMAAGAYVAVSSFATEVLGALLPVAGAVAGLASAPAAS